jgi:hypothetical protein
MPPQIGTERLTRAEITKRYRERKARRTLQITGESYDRMLAMRDGRTMERLLDDALDALDASRSHKS